MRIRSRFLVGSMMIAIALAGCSADDGIVINGKSFTYQIDGDALSLEPEPVDISACTTRECRFGATWVLMVAMPGTTWTRGEISPA